jgi:hypothetical protein
MERLSSLKPFWLFIDLRRMVLPQMAVALVVQNCYRRLWYSMHLWEQI